LLFALFCACSGSVKRVLVKMRRIVFMVFMVGVS
jgi:hypothetical protein